MTLYNQESIIVNGVPIAYEGKATVNFGGPKRESYGVVGDEKITTQDVSTEFSMIKFQLRSIPKNRNLVKTWFANGDNNVVIKGEDKFVGCVILEMPDMQDLELIDVEFEANALQF